MSIELLPYDNNQESLWDAFVENSWNGTFLHSRLFLSYHRDRFKDNSILITESNTRRLLGVFPLAENPNDAMELISHPGITYGGIIHQGGLRGDTLIQCYSKVMEYFAQRGYKTLKYKAIPHFYHKIPSGDDIYAMSRLNFQRYRCDLSATIDLKNRPRITKGRKSGLSKARRFGIRILSGIEYLLLFSVFVKIVVA